MSAAGSSVIRWLHEVDEHDVDRVGGKGANLGRLLHLGLPVPPGFVVTTDAYRAILAAPDLVQATPDQRRARLPTTPLPDNLSAAILDAYGRLAVPAVAMRSSGTAEDLAAASFAGQHDTFLNVVGPDALLDVVRGCWASLWSERAIAYRQAQGWDAQDVALAVVVQAMVPAAWAGVLFTADPVSGRRDRLVVEAVAGLGEALVSGQATPNHAVVEKARLRLLEGGAPLPVEALEELARLGLRIDAAFGQPQDIEWAYADGHCVILQARPLTTLPSNEASAGEAVADAAPDGRRYSRFQRAGAPQMLEHMPIPPFPFDYGFFYRPLMARVLQALHALGFATSALDEVFCEVAEGVVQAVPPSITPTRRVLALPPKLVGALRASPDAWLDECRTQLVAPAQQIDAADLARLSAEELLERIATLQERLLDLTLRRFGVLAPRLVLGQTFSLLLRLAVGRDAPRVQTELLTAVPCATTAANQELARLAGLIRAAPELRQVFGDAPPAQVAERLRTVAGGPALLAAVDAFLGRYGYRESAMPGAAFPAWRDDPHIVYGLLKGRVVGPPDTQEAAALAPDEETRAARARRTLLAAARGRGWRGLAMRLLLPVTLRRLAVARALIAFREDSHFALFGAFPVIRRLALELGRRLVAQGLLADPEEIFFLAPDEITALGVAADRPDTVRETVRRRKEARQSAAGRVTAVPVALLAQTATGGELQGAAASPGTATGPVRVIRAAHEFWTLQAGEVLVAPYTSPAWTPLFALASAVVVDAGGVASHAAIVAREYGIPAVMGTGSATRVLHDAQRVLVDGTRGRVVPFAAGIDAPDRPER